MILVQVLCTASLVTCLASQVCSVCLLLRFPPKYVLRFIYYIYFKDGMKDRNVQVWKKTSSNGWGTEFDGFIPVVYSFNGIWMTFIFRLQIALNTYFDTQGFLCLLLEPGLSPLSKLQLSLLELRLWSPLCHCHDLGICSLFPGLVKGLC